MFFKKEITKEKTSMTKIQIKRVYADPLGSHEKDGYRIFVDRLWPRGESKEKFHYDLWAKGVSPSAELREWFHQDPDGRWKEFAEKYTAELNSDQAMQSVIDEVRKHELVTLLFGARDEEHNNAVVLADYLRSHI